MWNVCNAGGDFEDSWLDDLQEKQAMKQQEEDCSAKNLENADDC